MKWLIALLLVVACVLPGCTNGQITQMQARVDSFEVYVEGLKVQADQIEDVLAEASAKLSELEASGQPVPADVTNAVATLQGLADKYQTLLADAEPLLASSKTALADAKAQDSPLERTISIILGILTTAVLGYGALQRSKVKTTNAELLATINGIQVAGDKATKDKVQELATAAGVQESLAKQLKALGFSK